jgi:predicted RNA-binding Zn-ribbon protein involved in translation (DUF1610 family)
MASFIRFNIPEEDSIVEFQCDGCGEVFIVDMMSGKNIDAETACHPECPSCSMIDVETFV